MQLLLVYVCIVVIFRFVYFGFHLENGKIPTLKIGFGDDIHDMILNTIGVAIGACIVFLIRRNINGTENNIGNRPFVS